MKNLILILLILISSCKQEVFETRLEIQNDMHTQINCIIYPKHGVNISCKTNAFIAQDGGFEIFYGVGVSKSPVELINETIDSIKISCKIEADTGKIILLFEPALVKNYKRNLFAEIEAWNIIETRGTQYNPSSKLHLETCTFVINSDSIIHPGK